MEHFLDHPPLPVVCLADDRNIIPVVHDALMHNKQAGQHNIPVVGLLYPRSSNTCRVLLGWVSKPISGTPSRQVCFQPTLGCWFWSLIICVFRERLRCVSWYPIITICPDLMAPLIWRPPTAHSPLRRSCTSCPLRFTLDTSLWMKDQQALGRIRQVSAHGGDKSIGKRL